MHLYFLLLLAFPCVHSYKIVTLPSSASEAQDIEHHLAVFFSTQIVALTKTVTSTTTQSVFQTCYSAEADITECQKRRDETEDVTPKILVNGIEQTWDSFIAPSRV